MEASSPFCILLLVRIANLFPNHTMIRTQHLSELSHKRKAQESERTRLCMHVSVSARVSIKVKRKMEA